MKKRRIAALASIMFAGGAALAVLGPSLPAGAQAASFDPCAAVNQGKLRYPTGTSGHLIFAISSAYSSNHVVVTECAKKDGVWTTVTTTTGRAGTAGFAEPGKKREGDGKTPTGSYTLTEAFGMGDPGTKLPYRTLHATGDCWGSTPGQRTYNEYYSGTCGAADEDLSATMRGGAYHQVVVIDYNRPKAVPGKGSAIFFHVGGVTPTSGCISIAEDRLRAIMRTLNKGDQMIMGPRAALFTS